MISLLRNILVLVLVFGHGLTAYCDDHKGQCLRLQGKLFSSVKLPVHMTYPAVVTEVLIKPGDKVKSGQVIVKYKLEQGAIIKIRETISPNHIKELEIRLHDIQKNIKLLELDRHDQQKLLKQGFGNKQVLKKLDIQIDHLKFSYQKTKDIYTRQSRSVENNKAILHNELGVNFSANHLPREVSSKSPTNGTVVWINQALRKGALIDLREPVTFISHLDDMILQARVHENEAIKLKINQKGSLTCSALPGMKFETSLQSINWTPIKLSVTEPPYYRADFKVFNRQSSLREGLQCRVAVGKNCQ